MGALARGRGQRKASPRQAGGRAERRALPGAGAAGAGQGAVEAHRGLQPLAIPRRAAARAASGAAAGLRDWLAGLVALAEQPGMASPGLPPRRRAAFAVDFAPEQLQQPLRRLTGRMPSLRATCPRRLGALVARSRRYRTISPRGDREPGRELVSSNLPAWPFALFIWAAFPLPLG